MQLESHPQANSTPSLPGCRDSSAPLAAQQEEIGHGSACGSISKIPPNNDELVPGAVSSVCSPESHEGNQRILRRQQSRRNPLIAVTFSYYTSTAKYVSHCRHSATSQ